MRVKPPHPDQAAQAAEDAFRQQDQFQAQAQRGFEQARKAHFFERRRLERRKVAMPVLVDRRGG